MLLQLCAAGPLLLPAIQGKGPAVQATAEEPEERNVTHMFSRYVTQLHIHVYFTIFSNHYEN